MEQPEDGCCCCRCCESLSTANGTTLDPYPLQPHQEHLEIFQWIGLETAELLPAYITRYYNNLHHQVNQQSHLRASDIIAWDYEYLYIYIYVCKVYRTGCIMWSKVGEGMC